MKDDIPDLFKGLRDVINADMPFDSTGFALNMLEKLEAALQKEVEDAHQIGYDIGYDAGAEDAREDF